MNYSVIKKTDVANGPGVRVSIFVSGCRNHCKGCFNKETWDFSYGKPFGEAAQNEVIEALRPNYIYGLSVLGGDPMEPENQEALLPFLKRVKEEFGRTRDIWLYTGYLLNDVWNSGLFRYIDVLVDGPFDESEKDAGLAFRGSRNQKIWNIIQSNNCYFSLDITEEFS